MKLLPLLPFIADYPFLKPAKSFRIEKGLILDNAISHAEKILREIFFGNFWIRVEEKPLYCDECEKDCRVFCERGALKDKRDWKKCVLCSKCFENCNYVISRDIYNEFYVKAKLSVYTYVAMMSALSGFPLAKRKFAVTLARAYRNAMEEDKSERLPEILAANFGIKMRRDEGITIHVRDYLKAAARIKSEDWKLCNRNLRKGYVDLSLKEFYRVVEEYLRELFLKDVSVNLNIEGLREIAAKFEFEKRDYKVKGDREFPPCMSKILSDLQMGENVPHTARFALTTFLLNIGYSINEIVDLFRKAPDFDEDKTRYQVEHIAGKRGSGKEYDTPSCSTMRTYQNCVAECGVRHPLEYYRKHKKPPSKRRVQ